MASSTICGCMYRHPAYWFQNRIYSPGTVDAVLEDSATCVNDDNEEMLAAPPPSSRVEQLEHLASDRMMLALIARSLHVTEREHPVAQLKRIAEFTRNIEHNFPARTNSAAKGYYRSPADFWWGGTEEMVIAKGSDWCHEVARVYSALCQVLGIACRLVYTASKDDGHVIAEAYWQGAWTLVDPLAAKVYVMPDGFPISVLDFSVGSSEELAAYTASGEGYYVNPVFFEHLHVAEYWLADSANYDYSASRCNPYYERLLAPTWNQ